MSAPQEHSPASVPQARPSVLLSTPRLGGAGGIERYAHSAIHALAQADVDLVVAFGEIQGGGWSEVPEGVVAVDFDRLRRVRQKSPRLRGGSLLRRDRALSHHLDSGFDIHLALSKRKDMRELARARLRLVSPAGKPVPPNKLAWYDAVAAESPSNLEFLTEAKTVVLLPPPVPTLPAAASPRAEVPKSFFLTVFNPYSSVKGVDLLAAIVEQLPLPLVWCHSARSIGFDVPESLRRHARIVHVDDPTPGEMRWLYERTAAYISFSRTEGFGWAIADALRYSPRIIARPTGVMSFAAAQQLQGVVIYDNPRNIPELLSVGPGTGLPRALPWLSPQAFSGRMMAMAREPRRVLDQGMGVRDSNDG